MSRGARRAALALFGGENALQWRPPSNQPSEHIVVSKTTPSLTSFVPIPLYFMVDLLAKLWSQAAVIWTLNAITMRVNSLQELHARSASNQL